MSKHPAGSLRGTHLHPDDKAHVLRAFVYRNTIENEKRRRRANKLPPITDARWLEITDFYVRQDGRLDERFNYCYTHDHEVPERKAIIDKWAQSKAGRRMPT